MNTAISYPQKMLLQEQILHSNVKKKFLYCSFQKHLGITECQDEESEKKNPRVKQIATYRSKFSVNYGKEESDIRRSYSSDLTEKKIKMSFFGHEKVSSFYRSRSNISALKNDRENETTRKQLKSNLNI